MNAAHLVVMRDCRRKWALDDLPVSSEREGEIICSLLPNKGAGQFKKRRWGGGGKLRGVAPTADEWTALSLSRRSCKQSRIGQAEFLLGF